MATGIASTLMTPAVSRRVKAKHAHYQPILQIAQQQARQSRRTGAPIFPACIVSQSGEFSHDFFATIEWLAKIKFREVADSLRLDGVAPGGATAIFCNDLKDELISAVWRGGDSVIQLRALKGNYHNFKGMCPE